MGRQHIYPVVLVAIAISLFNGTVGDSFLPEPLSFQADQIFKISGINDPQDRQSILQLGKENVEKTLAQFEWGFASSDHGLESLDASALPATATKDSKSVIATTESTAFSFEEKAKTGYEKLQKEALKRKKGYITFEDGENDDHLQNYMAYLYSKRIPEIIVVHGGNARVRLANYEAFWKAQSEETGCEIPQILLGGQGIEEAALFDLVEGVASIEPEKRKEMVENPMPKEQREKIAKETYEKVAAYIKQLDHVRIGLKTAPTDLREVIQLVGSENSKKKMLIAWASPGAFIERKTKKPVAEKGKDTAAEEKVPATEGKTETGTEVTPETTFEMHAKFNVNRNYPASDEVLHSGIPTILTGTGLSDTRARGLMDKEYANKLYKDFNGFSGLKQLMDDAKPGSFFHMVKAQQLSIQEKLVASGAEKVLLELQPKKALLEAAIKNPQQVKEFPFQIPKEDVEKYISPLPEQKDIDAKEKEYIKWRDGELLSKVVDLKNSDDPTKVAQLKSVLERELKATQDEELRVGHLFYRWRDFIKEPNFFQGCTDDPHLELIFNQQLRHASVRELIPISLNRLEEGRPQLFKFKVEKDSNCYILADINHEVFLNMFQHLIDWHNNKSPDKQMPWEEFSYTIPTTS